MLFKMDTSIRQTPGDCPFSYHSSVITATKLFMKQSLLFRPTTGAGLNSLHLKKNSLFFRKYLSLLRDIVMIFHWVTLTGSVILLLFVFTTVVLGTGHYLCGGGGGGGGIFFVLA